MKNLIIFVLLISTLVVGYYAATTLRMPLDNLEGKLEKVTRADLTLPINATGVIRPGLRIELKSEASGEVIEIAKRGGDRVKKGELLVRLQKDDEQRSVDRASQELQIAEARMNSAKIVLELAQGADLANAKAQVDQLSPMVEYAKYRMDRLEKLEDSQKNPEESLQRKSEYLRQVAQLDSAKAGLEKAKLAIPRAEYEYQQAKASHETSKANFADAQKRLNKTDIVAPIDGVVGDIRTQIGEVIQGGKNTITGGTVLGVMLDDSKVIVRAEVDESDIGRVLDIAPAWAQPGHDGTVQMPADPVAAGVPMEHAPKVSVEAFREAEFTGIIERIYPEPTSVSGVVTYLVDVMVIGDKRKMLMPGMRGEVTFTSEHVANALLCPNEAIKESSTGEYGVYIPKPGGALNEHETEFVACKFGLDNGNYSEVREGNLKEGQLVYTRLPAKREDREKTKKKK